MAYLTTTTSQQSGVLARLASAFDNTARALKTRKLYRETFNGLNALSDRELADLGLYRGDLRRVAWDSARGAAA